MKRRHGIGHILLLACALAAWSVCAQEAQVEETAQVTPPPAEGLSVNFRGVSLDTFLEFLSEKAGFVINREVQVEGEVDVSSHRPLNQDELFNLLVTVLNSKGYTALRNERTLTIVRREDALKRDIPVRSSSEPDAIPKNDEMVTQIIPIRHAEAKQLLENLKPLLPEYANASANESSNAIVITDIQANVRRMAEIVNALDTSISSISTVRVFTLKASDAEDVANVINELFESDDSGSSGGGASARNQRMGGPPGFPMMPGGGGMNNETESDSAAREAVSRVVAVEDERTNSVVVAAPEEVMQIVEGVIADLEASEGVQNEVRVFPLEYADAEDTAELVTALFENEQQSSSSSSTGVAIPSFGGGRMGPGGGPGGIAGGMGGTRQSSLSSEQALVVAEADVRTNSVVVNAPAVYMETIASMIDDLDKNPAKKRKVFIYKLENADPESVAEVVSGMFSEGSSSSSSTAARSSNTSQRSTTSSSSSNSNSSSQRSSSSGGSSQSQF